MLLSELNWNDLKCFLVVARDGSLAKAASSLAVTHSTVFRRIQKLEEDLGLKLFARVPQGYELTLVGLSVLEYVENTANEIESLLRFVDHQSHDLAGEIKITAPHHFAQHCLLGYIADFQRDHPQIQINLLVNNDQLDLNRNEADLAIRITAEPPQHLIAQHLFTLNWRAFASADHLDEHGTPNNLQQLTQDHWLIAASGDLTKLAAFAWLEKHISPEQIIYRCNDLLSISRAAEQGIGIAILPADQATPGLRSLFTLPSAFVNQVWILMHPDLRESRRINLFKKYLIHRFQNEPTLNNPRQTTQDRK